MINILRLVLGDVNNYIAITEEGKSKCKGRFEYKDLALHKNKSFLIIPKAVYAYFVNGVKPEKFIKENLNIFDFCGGVKIKGDWIFTETKVVKRRYSEEKLQQTIRYYISNTGSKIIKKNNTDNREIQVEAGNGYNSTMIDYVEKPFEEYDINYDYYLEKIKKEILNLRTNYKPIKFILIMPKKIRKYNKSTFSKCGFTKSCCYLHCN
jgi:hypothetical protein